MKIFTWHIHGSYLYYLSQGNYEIYIPLKDERTEGYYGRGETFPFGPNVIEVPVEQVKLLEFDLILFQTNQNYLKDQYEILSDEQRKLPQIYLEHDPPRQHPTDTKHCVDDPNIMLVHVTNFNSLMWNCGKTPTCVIEHGVTQPNGVYTGEIDKGIVVINNLSARGRLLGADIFQEVRNDVPLDLVGMGTEDWGLGEVLHPELPKFVGKYRFFFNPIRYTSFGLAVCEAMMLGVPVVGLATTEMASVIDHGYSGFVSTNIYELKDNMQMLLEDPQMAREIGANGRKLASQRFSIKRFAAEWEQLFSQVCGKSINSFPFYENISI